MTKNLALTEFCILLYINGLQTAINLSKAIINAIAWLTLYPVANGMTKYEQIETDMLTIKLFL